jgi:hypothetical protein
MVAEGWTPSRIRDLFALAHHAVEHRTGAWHAWVGPGLAERVDVQAQADEISEALVLAVRERAQHVLRGAGDGWGWMVLLCASPSLAEFRRLRDLLRDVSPEGRTEWRAWSRVPAPVAPWAWAAGASAVEASTMKPESARSLRGLATLRGWVFPAD